MTIFLFYNYWKYDMNFENINIVEKIPSFFFFVRGRIQK